eukprot:SAG25_NODE_4225_length_860_cov_1.227332_2_plen_31_part_01
MYAEHGPIHFPELLASDNQVRSLAVSNRGSV